MTAADRGPSLRDRPVVLALRPVLREGDADDVARLRSSVELLVVDDLADPQVDDHVTDAAKGLLVTGLTPVPAAVLDRFPRLETLAVRAVGYDNVDIEACVRRGVSVSHTPGVLDGAVVEHTVALILALTRRLPASFESAASSWHATGQRPPLGTDLRGKTVGIIGFGRIGRSLARTLHTGFDVDVLHDGRHPVTSSGLGFARPVPRDVLLETADIVSVHLPLTPTTAGSIGRKELARMRPEAYLVCTARGGIIDEAALAEAVRSGALAGAALDVMETEPYPPDGELQGVPGILLTPHVASATRETRAAMSRLAIDNLLYALAGEEPPALVPGT